MVLSAEPGPIRLAGVFQSSEPNSFGDRDLRTITGLKTAAGRAAPDAGFGADTADVAEVDGLVVATGYQNMSESVRALFGGDVAGRVGPVQGLDDDGEVRAIWRRTGQFGLWIMGGSLQQCRPYSEYLALQIKGCQEGLVPLAPELSATDRPAAGRPGERGCPG